MTCWILKKNKNNGYIYPQDILCTDGDVCMNPLWILCPTASPDYIFNQFLDEQKMNYSSRSNAMTGAMKVY